MPIKTEALDRGLQERQFRALCERAAPQINAAIRNLCLLYFPPTFLCSKLKAVKVKFVLEVPGFSLSFIPLESTELQIMSVRAA